MPRDDDDRPRKSWREIDRQKDRSKHRQEEKTPLSPQRKARADSASKAYKSKLNAFFDGQGSAPKQIKGRLIELEDSSPEGQARIAALKAIKEAGTSSAADKAVAAYLEQWDLPPDYDVLSPVLTCSAEDYVNQAMDLIKTMLEEKRIPRRTELLAQRLHRVAALAEEPAIAAKANELMRILRLFS